MKELVIISGKGGTGKTSLVSAFSAMGNGKVICDADVDAADLHLILAPEILETHDFVSGNTACIRKKDCTQCGLCRELCRFEAINENFEIDPIACEGCGVCYHFCPENAIDFPENTCGQWYISNTRFGPLVHARLGIAEENSGKLVTRVRGAARETAEKNNSKLILTDGPPGVGCPVIASLGGADAALIVTEPSVSGIHDMERVYGLCMHFRIPAFVVINKFDINQEMEKRIQTICREKDIEILGKIPFDPVFVKAMVMEKTLPEYAPEGELTKEIQEIWKKTQNRLGTGE